MATYAVIENNKVTNIIEAENASDLPFLNLVPLQDGYGIGDNYNNGVFSNNKNLEELEAEKEAKEQELAEVDKQLFDLMCQDFSNRLQEVQTLPEVKDEVISLMTRKDTLIKEIASLEQEIAQVMNSN